MTMTTMLIAFCHQLFLCESIKRGRTFFDKLDGCLATQRKYSQRTTKDQGRLIVVRVIANNVKCYWVGILNKCSSVMPEY